MRKKVRKVKKGKGIGERERKVKGKHKRLERGMGKHDEEVRREN